MHEHKERLRALELIQAPDLREGIRSWEPSGPRVEPRRGRVGVILLALAIAGASIVFAVRAFRGTEHPPRPATTIQNGKIAFAALSGGYWQIFSVEPSGSEPSQLTTLATDQLHPAWSPDGNRIAFSAQNAEGRMEVDVMDADGSDVVQLTEGASGWSYLPAWSPDASRIVFVSNQDGNDEIYVMEADGSNQVRLTHQPGEDLSPAWSPDGTRIAFQSNRGGNNEIIVMNPDGTGVTNLTDASASGEFDPAWSPDGTKIAFASDRDGNPEIYVMNADGSDVTRLTDDPGHDWNPAWAPDGSRIAFESDRDGAIALYTMGIDGTNPVRLIDTEADACCPAWQPMLVSEAAPTPTLSPRVTATIPVGSFPRDIAVGAGAIWVSVNDFTEGEPETHSLVRIDPVTNEIVATIPVGTASNLAVGSDAVWTIDSFDKPQDTVVRIDPATNEVVGTIPVGPYAFDVAVDASSVWVTRDIEGSGQSGEVIRIDPATNEVVARIPVEGRIRDVVVGEGGVWVVDSTSTLTRGSSLIHIDPEANELVATIPGLAGLNVTTGGGLVWMHGWLSTIDPSVGTGSGDRPLVLRVDPATDQFVGDPIPMSFFRPFAVWEGCVWFVGEESAVSHLNTTTLEVDHSVDVAPVAQDSTVHAALDTSTGTIWVANYQNTVTRVDLK